MYNLIHIVFSQHQETSVTGKQNFSIFLMGLHLTHIGSYPAVEEDSLCTEEIINLQIYY